MKKTVLTFLGLFYVFLIVAQNNYYVSTSGNNSNNGSITQPWVTIQYGLNNLQPGDILNVGPGIYNEALSFPISGSAVNGYITLMGSSGAIIDGSGQGPEGVSISSKNYIKVIGLEVRNFSGSNTPIGISISGSSSNLEILNNIVHHIESPNDNAHGIAFYGSSSSPINNITVDGNEIRNCKLGQSEALVLNGNVTNFIVSNNIVHDNDNIGIDFIGFEGTGPIGSDQARDGICSNNIVYNTSSLTNATYGGERSADGIYVDGGKNIIIEKNKVYDCDIGIELACEHQGKNTEDITIRNNFVSGSYQANIMAGGYDANRGNAVNIIIVNNTTYEGTGGELALQYNCDNIVIKNNIFYANSSQAYLQNWGSNNSSISVDNNMYYGESTSSSGDWPDANAKFMNPQLVSPSGNMHIGPSSPAIDLGINLGNDGSGNPISGTQDFDNQPRVINNIIDIGAHEFNIATGMEENPILSNAYESIFEIFPNPNMGDLIYGKFRSKEGADSFSITEKKLRVCINDMLGTEVFVKEIPVENGMFSFSFANDLVPGMYLFVGKMDNNRYTKTIVVK